MIKKENLPLKTTLNIGFCETNSEWLNRIITELADEDRNFVNLEVICR